MGGGVGGIEEIKIRCRGVACAPAIALAKAGNAPVLYKRILSSMLDKIFLFLRWRNGAGAGLDGGG